MSLKEEFSTNCWADIDSLGMPSFESQMDTHTALIAVDMALPKDRSRT